jgi:type II secretion system protein D
MGPLHLPPLAAAFLVAALIGIFPDSLRGQDAAPAPVVPPAPNAPAVVPPAPPAPPAPAVDPATAPLPAAPVPMEAVAPPPIPPQRPTQPEPTVRLTFPNTSVNEILSLYETLTDKRLVRDSMLAQGQPLTIVVPGEVPRSEAIRLIEASLLLNGYSFVPVDEKTTKVLGPSKFPRAEGIPIFSSPYMLPATDQVVSYFMKLNYLSPQEAAQLFQTFVSPPKAYTSFTPVPNVQAVLITENVPIIQQLISLQTMVDVPPAQVMTEFIELKRADSEKVVELLQSLLEQRKEGAGTPGQPGAPNPGGAPQVDAQGQVIQASIGGAAGGQFESNLVIGETQFVADPRTNRILVVTRPVNFPYIKQLIEQLDAAVPLDSVLERPLQFVSAGDVLPVLQDLLSEGEEGGTGGGATRAGESSATVDSGSTFGQGMGSDAGGGAGAGTSRPDRIKEPTADVAPESVIVGNTKLIADKSANSIIAIGPPDSRQKVAQLLGMLDVRPRQVYIAAVIGELKLSDEMEFGFNYFLRNQSKDGNSVGGALLNPLTGAGTNLFTPPDLITPAALAASAFTGLTLYGTIANSLDYYVRALETTGKFKILSRPVVYTTNNKKAVISSGQRVPYTSSTLTSTSITGVGPNQNAGVTANITYLDVLLKLEVLPLINANKDVTLVIVQTNNNVLGEEQFGGGNKAPIVGSQELTTTVTVPSGGTIVLGGLIVEKTDANDGGLPFLMRLPVLGYIFKQTTRAVERRELLVLLQPTVVENDAETAIASAEERYRSKLGDELYDEADAWKLGRTPVINDSPMLTPDARVRKPRDPLRPAGVDYQEYAPPPRAKPTPKPTPVKKKRSAS